MSRRPRAITWRKALVVIGVLALLALNLVAYLHAGSMSNWSKEGQPSRAPEHLGAFDKLGVLVRGVSVPRPMNERAPSDHGLEYESRTIPNGRGESLGVWFLPGTDDQIVALLFPGYASSKEHLLPHAQAFLELGASVLLVDYYGSGDSSGSGTSLGVFESHDVVAVTSYARSTWPRAKLVLYGQSMGGAAVLRAVALEGVEPDGLAIESTFDRMLSAVGARFRRMGLPAWPGAQLLLFWGGVRLGTNAFAHNPVQYAEQVSCPTLLLQSAQDSNVSDTQARGIYEALGGWKLYAESPTSRHCTFLISDRDRWIANVTALLSQL